MYAYPAVPQHGAAARAYSFWFVHPHGQGQNDTPPEAEGKKGGVNSQYDFYFAGGVSFAGTTPKKEPFPVLFGKYGVQIYFHFHAL